MSSLGVVDKFFEFLFRYFFALDEAGLALEGAPDLFGDQFLHVAEGGNGEVGLAGYPAALHQPTPFAGVCFFLELIVDLLHEGLQFGHGCAGLVDLAIDSH